MPPGGPEPVTTAIEETGHADLFPYVFLRPWPTVPAGDLENRFVRMPGSSAFHDALVEARDQGGRQAVEAQAIAFLEGRAPYEGRFLRRLDGLAGPLRWFAACDREAREKPFCDLQELLGSLERLTGEPWLRLAAYLLDSADDYVEERGRVWDSLLALLVISGFDVALLEGLTRTVVMASLLERIAADPIVSEGEEAGPILPPATSWPVARLRAGVRGTVILPDLFPLPPGGRETASGTGSEAAPPPPNDWLVPSAVGCLQMVQQKLAGYTLGEVCAIENVLRGELKETTQRRLTRREKKSRHERSEISHQEAEASEGESDFLSGIHESLAETLQYSYTSTYGPPTQSEVTISGSSAPSAKSTAAAGRFAREVAARTAQHITRKVHDRRSFTLLREDEETVVRRFDATASPDNVRGVYRWVNKVYALRVVNRGHRLLLEIRLARPAAPFIRGELALSGQSLEPPMAPEVLGLRQPSDLSTDPQSPLYWMGLAARYRVLEVAPPPLNTRTSSLALDGASALLGQVIAVPEGYRARHARLAVNWQPGGSQPLSLAGIIGEQPFSFSSAGTESRQTLPLSDETGEIPLAVTGSGDGFVLNVEVESALTSERREEWQLRAYREILDAYERRRESYFDAAEVRPGGEPSGNPLAWRETERRELTRGIRTLLLLQAQHRIGVTPPLSPGGPRVFPVSEPAYLQFFDEAFEWREMTWSFEVLNAETAPSLHWFRQRFPGADSLFTAFLEASSARVLLPVRPPFNLRVPYFLASGIVWPGSDTLTPSHSVSIPLVDDLKSLESSLPFTEALPRSWRITVPTSMMLLQDSPDLPLLSWAEAPPALPGC
jgi:hypothetical protein